MITAHRQMTYFISHISTLSVFFCVRLTVQLILVQSRIAQVPDAVGSYGGVKRYKGVEMRGCRENDISVYYCDFFKKTFNAVIKESTKIPVIIAQSESLNDSTHSKITG